MIQEYSKLANLGILGGLVLSIGSRFLPVVTVGSGGATTVNNGMALAAHVAWLAGVGLFIWGCCMYAKAKGRSSAWGAFGLLTIIGLIVLVFLKDHAKDGYGPEARGFEVQPVSTRTDPPPVPRSPGV